MVTIAGQNELAAEVRQEAAALLEKSPHIRATFQPNMAVSLRDKKLSGVTWSIDSKRFISSIGAIVRGLYYYHTYFEEKILGEVQITWNFLKAKDVAMESLKLSASEYLAFTSVPPNQPRLGLGANPRVFQYAFDQDSDETHDICALRFYEGETIYAKWKKLEAREWSTDLESLIEYVRDCPPFEISPSLLEKPEFRADWIRRHEERDERLIKIISEARHKRDIAAMHIAKLLRKRNYRDKISILGQKPV